MNKEVDHQIRLARSYAAKQLPWFSSALFKCHIIYTELIPVAGIDQHYNVYWNPKSVSLIHSSTSDKAFALQQLAYIWVHEICHVLRSHASRSAQFEDPIKWNYAADLEINDSQWPGIRPPVLFAPIIPEKYDLPEGKTAEWYYKNLVADYVSIATTWDDGSGVHGINRPWEVAETSGQKLTDLSRVLIQRKVAKELKTTYRGKLPGGWGIWVQQLLEPIVDWRKILKKRLCTAIAKGRGGRTDYSFKSPNRRAAVVFPIILPALSGNEFSQLSVVIDTSGSMIGDSIKRAMTEVYGILKQMHANVMLIPCDAQDYKPHPLKSPNELLKLMELPGGGGTNMITGVEAALSQNPKPDTIIVITDGYTDYPMKRYPIPVIWGIISPDIQGVGNHPPDPPWGKDTVVMINPEPS